MPVGYLVLLIYLDIYVGTGLPIDMLSTADLEWICGIPVAEALIAGRLSAAAHTAPFHILTFLVLFGFHLCGFVFYAILIRPCRSPLRHLPSPPQPPLRRRLFKEPSPWLFEKWINEVPNDGIIRYFGAFNSEKLLLTSPRAVRDVLVANPYSYGKQAGQRTILEPVLGRGLVTVEGNLHKHQRRQLAPGFKYRHIKAFQQLFWAKTNQLLQTISSPLPTQGACANALLGHESSSRVIEMHDLASRTSLDIIGIAAYSIDFDSIRNPASSNKLLRGYRIAFEPSLSNKIRCLLAQVLPGWLVNHLPLKRNVEIACGLPRIRTVCRQLVASKRNALRNTEIGRWAPVKDIIENAIQGGGFSDEQLVHQCMTLLAAGHETTASAVSSAVWFLSQPKYHSIQERLRAEIRASIPSPLSDNFDSPRQLEALPYLTAVRNEVLRLNTPFSWFGRVSTAPTLVSGHAIPTGTAISLSPWALHRSTSIWGLDAAVFNPDRWLLDPTGRGGAQAPYSLLTFGAGPRVCVGDAFAKAEISTMMAGIFGRFDVTMADDGEEEAAQISHQMTLAFKGGVRARLTPLHGW